MSTINPPQFFITEQYLKDSTDIDNNFDMKILRYAIRIAQERKIRPLLGSTLYSEIKIQLTGSTLTTANSTLLYDYIQPATAEWAYFLTLVKAYKSIKNKGLLKRQSGSENSENVDLSDLKFLMEQQKEMAEGYGEDLVLFLRQNRLNYPSYNTPGTGLDVVRPSVKAYSSSIWLGSSKNTSNFSNYNFENKEDYDDLERFFEQ